ncbi:MAG: sigma 54-interacting transcriptional regulator [bacterium]
MTIKNTDRSGITIEDTLISNKSNILNDLFNLKLYPFETLVGNWYWDIVKDEFYFSDNICHILGWEPGKKIITYKMFLKSIHPADREYVNTAIERALNEKKIYCTEHRIILMDGSVRTVQGQAQISFDEIGRPRYMLGTIHDISEKKRIEKELTYRHEFENILITLSTNFIKLSIEETDTAINNALKIIGEFAGFDRSYIFIFSKDLKRMDNTHEWCSSGVDSQIHRLKGLSTDQFPWWMDKIKSLETIYIPSVENLPPEAKAEKEEFRAEKIQSLISVPMIYKDTLLGFVGFDAVREKKECPDEFINLLRIVGDIFINTLERRRAQKAIHESQNKLNAMISSIGDYICMIDKDFNLLWANDITKRAFGNDILGKKCYDVYHQRKEPCEPFPCPALKTFLDGKVHEREILLKTKNGQTRYCHWITNVALRDKRGNPTAVIQIARDITARKHAEEELREARKDLEERVKKRTEDLMFANEKLRKEILVRKQVEEELRLKDKAIASSINAFAIADLEGNHTYVNNAFLKLWGYDDSKEILGRPAISFLYDKDKGLKAAKELRKTGSWTGELVAKRKDGTLFDVNVSASIVRDESGKPICEMASFADITKRKRTEEKLAYMFSELEKSRDDMSSILNMLRIGTAITDKDGRIKFLSESAQRIIGISQDKALGRHWEELFPLRDEEKVQLRLMASQEPVLRRKLPIHIETPGGKRYWIEIEVQDEPGNPARKILFFYDMSEIYDLRRMLDEKAKFHDLIGKSNQMRYIYQQIQEVSTVDWTVLIEGETGTGKELVARAIHYSSPRENKPFIPINCAGLTDSLLTSQLFGHKRGAFTGAIEDHVGLFEAANGGTIFLDEIGDISLSVQTNLLRVLEEKEITRVGESKSKKINVRIIAATHKNLTEEVDLGNFRPDLFYRIRVARIKIPPLRERKEDIPLLVAAFLGQCRAASGRPVQDISNDVMSMFLEYNWPGNVRELKSAIEFAVTHCKTTVIQMEDIPPEIRESLYKNPLFIEIQQDERDRILSALKKASGSRTRAARLLGISRATLYRRMFNLKIKNIKK